MTGLYLTFQRGDLRSYFTPSIWSQCLFPMKRTYFKTTWIEYCIKTKLLFFFNSNRDGIKTKPKEFLWKWFGRNFLSNDALQHPRQEINQVTASIQEPCEDQSIWFGTKYGIFHPLRKGVMTSFILNNMLGIYWEINVFHIKCHNYRIIR